MNPTPTTPAPSIPPVEGLEFVDHVERRRPASHPAPRRAIGTGPTARHVTAEPLRRWSAHHPVAAFLVIGFAIAYPVMSLPIMASHGVIADGWMPQTAGLDAERIASFLGILLGLLPAALWVTWATDGTDGVRSLGRRMRRWQIGARWWALVLAGLPALTLTIALLLGDTLTPVDIGPFVAGQTIGLLVNLLLINMWEETAWAGVVQTKLGHTHGLAKAALLTAVPFALFHLPLHFIGDYSIGSLTSALVTLLIVCVIVRLMIGAFLTGTGGSILAVALLHTLFNRSNNDEGLIAALVEGDGRKLAGLISVLILTAAAAMIARQHINPDKDPK